jgi:hypothetical protein
VERVNVPSAPVAPMTQLPTELPPLSPDQVKALLYKIYVPAYRLQDLLGQEHPEKWPAPEAERKAFSQAREASLSKLSSLEKLRAQLADRPSSSDLAFQTYALINSLISPLETISRGVAKYGSPKLADEYSERGRQLSSLGEGLAPYITFFLRNQDRVYQMLENNLSSCQKQLGYAMHSSVQPATPMVNVNPVFQGHGRVHHADPVVAKASNAKSNRQKAVSRKQKAPRTTENEVRSKAKAENSPSKAGDRRQQAPSNGEQ